MNFKRRLAYLTSAILAVLGGGTAGFYVLGRLAGLDPSVLDCAYQTVITLATVGSREMQPLSTIWYGEIFIIVLVLTGFGVLGLFATTVTAFFVEGEVHNVFRRRKMDKALQQVKDHVIVCGAGETGGHVIRELLATGQPVVVVDTDPDRIQRIHESHPKAFILHVEGHASDDLVLKRAGLERARGIVVALPDDRDNLFVTVTARQTNPNLRIVARASDTQLEERMKRAGADAVVSPSRIGGMRIASEMIRPQVVSFLDGMLRNSDQPWRIEEIPLRTDSPVVGRALRDTRLRTDDDLLVLAIRNPAGDAFVFNPDPDHILEGSSTLIVLGPVESVHRIRERIS